MLPSSIVWYVESWKPIRVFAAALDSLRMVLAVLVLTGSTMVGVAAWTLLVSRTSSSDGLDWSSSVFPSALQFGTEVIPTLSFFVTLTVSSVLANSLSKYSAAHERFNCFCGQCYDLALLLANLARTTETLSDQSMVGALSPSETMQAIGLLPLIVKFVLRGKFNLKSFVGRPTDRRVYAHPHPTAVLDRFQERYVAARQAHPDDKTMPFQVMFELIVRSLEGFKDQGLLTELEWDGVTRRLQTVYGPWGDMVTKSDYAQPRLIKSLLSSTLYLYYAFLVPYLVARFNDEASSVLAGALVVFVFSGCYESSRQIENPFASAKENPFFFSEDETVTNTGKATRINVQRLTVSATPMFTSWGGSRR